MATCDQVKGFSYEKLEKEETALKEIFVDLKEVVSSPDFDDFLQEKLSRIYPDFLNQLQKRKDDLFIRDCGILVVGDTSSGKSTFINCLIDEDLLETDLYACTTMIFKIISSEKIRVKTYGAGKRLLKDYGDIASRDDLKRILREIGKENGGNDEDSDDSSRDKASNSSANSESDGNEAETTTNTSEKNTSAATERNEGECYTPKYTQVSFYSTDSYKDYRKPIDEKTLLTAGSHDLAGLEKSAQTTDETSSDFVNVSQHNSLEGQEDSNEETAETDTVNDNKSNDDCDEKDDIDDKELCREVEIYYPTPKLKGNVMIVDSPGFGDSEELTQRLREYLLNAVSFIFIIDVNRAGGLQKHGILRVLTEIREKQVDMFSFDPADVVFVMNKWDAVPCKKEDKHYIKRMKKKTKRKIKDTWPTIKEDHILPLSAAMVDKSKNDEYLQEYRAVENAILKVLERNENKRVKTHFRFLEDFILRLSRIVLPRYGTVFLGENRYKELVKSNRKKLEKLKESCEKMERDHGHRIQDHLLKLADKVSSYLHTNNFQKRILSENDRKWSSYKKVKIGSEVAERIEKATKGIIQTEAQKLLENEISKMLLDDFDKIKREIHGIDSQLSGLKEPYNINRKIPFTAITISGSASMAVILSISGIASLGLVGGLILGGAGLISLGYATYRFVQYVFNLEGPHDTVACAAYEERMLGYDLSTIKDMLDESFGKLYRNMNSHLFQHVFPEEIKCIELSVEGLESEISILKDKKEALKCLKQKLDELKRKTQGCYQLIFEKR